MTYFGFLGIFVGTPLVILLNWTLYDRRRGKRLPSHFQNWPVWPVLLGHTLIALIYTTPWDNYLVATGVWWYDPALVTGLTLGWVPIEEYTFFIVQPLLAGLWLLLVMRYVPIPTTDRPLNHQPWRSLWLPAGLWLGSILVLLSGWQPGTYLALELGWALPPIMIQLAFGADILWRYRRLVLLGILVPTLYLAMADAVAIGAGTWTFDPAQSLNIFLAGQLPIEEFIFFLLTNILLTFGITLALAQESESRLASFREHFITRSTSA
jgi:lycopene cyclase domain-containing protein